MQQAVPLEESVELFNRLTEIPLESTGEIGRIAWRLRKLTNSPPGSMQAGVALTRAHIMLGEPAEVCRLTEIAFQSRCALDRQVAGTLAGQLLDLGFYEEFLVIADENLQPVTEQEWVEATRLRASTPITNCSFP